MAENFNVQRSRRSQSANRRPATSASKNSPAIDQYNSFRATLGYASQSAYFHNDPTVAQKITENAQAAATGKNFVFDSYSQSVAGEQPGSRLNINM